jgi:ubiquinone/menaquinone biosynthesis C-methylase UbiE
MSNQENQMKESVQDVLGLLGQTWTGVAVSAGVVSKIYDEMSTETPVTIEEIANKKYFDKNKLASWFYIMEHCGIVRRTQDQYYLTAKGNLLSSNSPSKDVLGMFNLNRFYMLSAINGFETFKTGRSLDKLGEGKMSNVYTPRVTDKFSEALLGYIKAFGVQKTDTLLDIGCGRGNFLKNIAIAMPGMKLAGIDSNRFAIEAGKLENSELEKSGNLNLIMGDITEDLSSYDDDSFDWCTAINVFHFIPQEKRLPLIANMFRISRKGLFMSLVVVEKTVLARSADPLMFLLWNDFTGFFKEEEFKLIVNSLKKQHKNCTFKTEAVMEGNSNLVIVTKQKK